MRVLVLLVALLYAVAAEMQELARLDRQTSTDVQELPRLGQLSSLTVSGLSSGAYMAVQMHVAFSASVNGSAIFAGGPFYCAESNVEYAQYRCMETSMGPPPSTTKLVALTNTDFGLGFVDNPKNMNGHPVYLFSGTDDSVVEQTVGKALNSYYDAFGADVRADFNVASEHCMPTLDYGEECTTLGSPYIGNCGFDGAGKAFQKLYGADNLVEPTDADTTLAATNTNLHVFDQTPFFNKLTPTSLADRGYLYIPTACAASAASADGSSSNPCRLHVSFHGCKQGEDRIGNTYAAHAGYNRWAEANNIVVLYPYAEITNTVPFNPKGCWDWWAYSGVTYGTKQGLQPQFVKKLVERLGFRFDA